MNGDAAGRGEVEGGRAGAAGPDAGGRKRGPVWRTVVAALLGILMLLVLTGAVLATWIHWTTFNTDRFVNTLAPLLDDAEVRAAIRDEAVTRLFDELELRERIETEVRKIVPGLLKDLAGEQAAAGAEALAKRLTDEILKTDRFKAVWRAALTATHEQVVSGLRSEGAVQLRPGGRVVLDVTEVVVELKERLVDIGLTFLEDVEVPEDLASIELYQDSRLERVREGVATLDALFWVLPFVSVLGLIGAIAVANDRRRAFLLVGVGMVVILALTLAAVSIARSNYINDIGDAVNREAAEVVAGRVQGSLNRAAAGIMVLGLLSLVAAVLAGPYGWAASLRRMESRIAGRLGRREAAGSIPARYPWLLRTAGLAAAVLVVLYLPQVSTWAIVAVCVIYGLYLAAVGFLR